MNEQPNNETLIQSSSRDLQIIEDDAFSYEGYQVVRGEFFAHTYEPSFTFNANKVSVNTACIKKLPKTDFVQILVNPDEKDSFRWCSATKKRSPRQITCRIFFAKVITLMGWNSSYRYKLLGKLIRSDNELLFVFDLTTPEIYVRTAKDDGKIKTSRTPTYPAEWQNQFGVPIEEHQSNLQINMFDGYAVFGISENTPPEEPKNPAEPQKEETHYEQSSLFTANPMH